jgi:peptide/nickel transport system permease protein
VLDEPAHPYTMALLAANPHVPDGLPVPERLASIAGTVPAPGSWPTGCRFAGRCRFAQASCTVPFPALPAHGDGAVRCIRVDEVAGAGATWTAEEIGAEVQPGAGAPAPVEPTPTAGVSS